MASPPAQDARDAPSRENEMRVYVWRLAAAYRPIVRPGRPLPSLTVLVGPDGAPVHHACAQVLVRGPAVLADPLQIAVEERITWGPGGGRRGGGGGRARETWGKETPGTWPAMRGNKSYGEGSARHASEYE